MLKKSIFILLLALFFRGVAQNTNDTVAPWRLMYLNGEISLKSHYREESWILKGGKTTNENNALSGGFELNTKSYVWHPNFLQLDIGGSYAPGRYEDNFTGSRDYYIANTTKGLNLGATFFDSKPVTFKVFTNYIENYQKRENLTNIKVKTVTRGGSIDLKNKIFPLGVSYIDSKWNQEELPTGRNYDNNKKSLQAKVIKSFFSFDRHVLDYTHDENEYIYYSDIQGLEPNRVINTINRVNLFSKVFFSNKRASNFNSVLTYHDQKGNFAYKRLLANEGLMLFLPKNIQSVSKYEYLNTEREKETTIRQVLRTDLSHQLFSSLKTSAFFKYTKINNSFYDESEYRGGLSFAYSKKIPTKGTLRLNYSYFRYHDDMKSETLFLNIFREEHVLLDAGIEMLDKPYIDIASVVVTNVTSTVVYQLNFDYTLVQMGNFIEIRRIPGGLIPDGGTIYIDYQATQPGTYNYDANNHSFFASVLLFKQLVEFYYRRNQQDYINVNQVEFLSLNYFTENIVGTRVKFKFAEAGVEYNSYKSTIVPYQMMRYYTQISHNFSNKILFTLQGSVRDYKLINNQLDQTYIDISSRVAYSFKPQTKLSLDLGYRDQIGDQINLKLLTMRTEFTTLIRELYLTLGVEAYRRDYLEEEIKLNGAYVRITRKF